MKFSCSNLAWNKEQEKDCLNFLRGVGITGVEIAPTVVWPNWEGATVENAKLYARQMNDSGFELPAMQAIVFGKPFTSIFNTTEQKDMLVHLRYIAELSGALGAKTVVFGAPKLRHTELPFDQAVEEITGFFQEVSKYFVDNNSCFCVEPCVESYGCNFVTNTHQATTLIDRVGTEGFGLHIDSAALFEGKDDMRGLAIDQIKHYHISVPALREFTNSAGPHEENLDWLYQNGYQNWCSVEMINTEVPFENRGPWKIIEKFLKKTLA